MGNTWGRYWRLEAEPFERTFLDFPTTVTEERWREIVALSATLPEDGEAPLLELEADPLAADAERRHTVAPVGGLGRQLDHRWYSPRPVDAGTNVAAQVVFRSCLVTCGGGEAVAAYDVIHDMDPSSDDLSGISRHLRDRGDAAATATWKRFLRALGWDGEGPRPSPLPWWIHGVYESDHWVGLSSRGELTDLWTSFAGTGLDALLRSRRPEMERVVQLFESAAMAGGWLLAVESCS